MKKILGILLVVLILIYPHIIMATDTNIPSDIQYIPTDQRINKKAYDKLKKVFAKSPYNFENIFGEAIACGPSLWNQIKNLEDFNDCAIFVPMPMRMSTAERVQHFEGAIFRGKENIIVFCNVLSKFLNSSQPFEIKKPNTKELKLYWAMIAWDIEEPIFVAHSNKHTLLLNFSNDKNLNVAWIDDLYYVSFKK